MYLPLKNGSKDPREAERALPCIIGWEQGAFVRNGAVSDNILLASEAHHTVTAARNNPGMFLKMDMEKAFDKVSWKCLNYIYTLECVTSAFPRHGETGSKR